MKKLLRILGILFLLCSICFGLVYTQFWNAKVAMKIINDGNAFPLSQGINEETATMPDIYVEPSHEDYLLRNKLMQRGESTQAFMQRIYWDTVLRKAYETAVSKTGDYN
jgi:hypothetical protein